MVQFLIPLAMGGLSYANQKAQNKAKEAQNLAEAEKTRYSAWSGLGGGSIDNQYGSPFMAGVGGALQGAALGQGGGSGWGALMGQGQQAGSAMNQQNQNRFGSFA